MAIITFWSNDNIETAQSMSMAAVATYLSIEHNIKVLMINTSQNDYTIEDGFWPQSNFRKKIIKDNDIATGLTGLTMAILSNKRSPDIVTHYTKIIFKNRLELLTDRNVTNEDFEKQKQVMKDIIQVANQYYDLVFVDLKADINSKYTKDILEISDIIIYNLTQRMRHIDNYLEIKQKENFLQKDNIMLLIGMYNPRLAKYTDRNIARYMREKEIYKIPFSNLFFEVGNEGMVADFFIKFRKVKNINPNAPFIISVEKLANGILAKLKEQRNKN